MRQGRSIGNNVTPLAALEFDMDHPEWDLGHGSGRLVGAAEGFG